ncbi:uncharacterized protein [Procambarus clarkii]|uniref:uncharacterized protein n=1 Tax=Procambarus clarkii TaxID=6728 RepID=UPI003744349C
MALIILLYDSETWTINDRLAKELNHFHLICLRRLLNIRWQEKIPDTKVLEEVGIPSVYTLLQKKKYRWADQVAKKPDSLLPKQLLYEKQCQGKHSLSRKNKQLMDCLKLTIRDKDTTPNTGELLSQAIQLAKA